MKTSAGYKCKWVLIVGNLKVMKINFLKRKKKLQTFVDWEWVESELRETASQKLMIRRDTDLSPNNKAEAKSRLVSQALNSSAAVEECSLLEWGRSNFAVAVVAVEYHWLCWRWVNILAFVGAPIQRLKGKSAEWIQRINFKLHLYWFLIFSLFQTILTEYNFTKLKIQFIKQFVTFVPHRP